MIKQSISTLLLLAFAFIHNSQSAMDYNDVGDHIYSYNVVFAPHQEMADFLTEKCRCPEHITKEFFQQQYSQQWSTVHSWDIKTKNKLLKKVLAKTNDPNYKAMRGAIAFLVSAGCNVDTTDKLHAMSALERAAMYDDYTMAQFLLGQRANPNAMRNGNSPIFFWISSVKMAQLFDSFKADFTLKNKNEFSVLHNVISKLTFEPELITFYCAHGVNVNDVEKRGHTALHELVSAIANYCKPHNTLLKQVQLLIDAGITQKTQGEIIQQLSKSTTTPEQLIKNYLEKNLNDTR
ncbi:hypothetical protein Noda2021_10740 [Candidatus Dependentiae bacterium Noda2021]|nr:hypothetical protein Noda2021_10740 [Candidatus Dependentiae bacterium Noda2021]